MEKLDAVASSNPTSGNLMRSAEPGFRGRCRGRVNFDSLVSQSCYGIDASGPPCGNAGRQ